MTINACFFLLIKSFISTNFLFTIITTRQRQTWTIQPPLPSCAARVQSQIRCSRATQTRRGGKNIKLHQSKVCDDTFFPDGWARCYQDSTNAKRWQARYGGAKRKSWPNRRIVVEASGIFADSDRLAPLCVSVTQLHPDWRSTRAAEGRKGTWILCFGEVIIVLFVDLKWEERQD